MTYLVLVDSKGNVKKSAFADAEDSLLKIKSEGDRIEAREYGGCPHWHKKDEFDF